MGWVGEQWPGGSVGSNALPVLLPIGRWPARQQQGPHTRRGLPRGACWVHERVQGELCMSSWHAWVAPEELGPAGRRRFIMQWAVQSVVAAVRSPSRAASRLSLHVAWMPAKASLLAYLGTCTRWPSWKDCRRAHASQCLTPPTGPPRSTCSCPMGLGSRCRSLSTLLRLRRTPCYARRGLEQGVGRTWRMPAPWGPLLCLRSVRDADG